MCKRFLATGFALMLIILTVNIASAQFPSPHPFIAVYFDDGRNPIEAMPPYPALPTTPCPGVGVLDTLTVMLVNANMWVSAVEFSVSYPPSLIWLADINKRPVNFGTTPSSGPVGGLSMGYGGNPGAGNKALFICNVVVMWNCDTCDGYLGDQIVVQKHTGAPPSVPYPQWTDFPFYVIHDAIGMTSLVCATVPAEETTWSKVKALYSD